MGYIPPDTGSNYYIGKIEGPEQWFIRAVKIEINPG